MCIVNSRGPIAPVEPSGRGSVLIETSLSCAANIDLAPYPG